MRHIVGISAFYPDAAATTLLRDGEIVAAMQEERFSRSTRKPLAQFSCCDQ